MTEPLRKRSIPAWWAIPAALLVAAAVFGAGFWVPGHRLVWTALAGALAVLAVGFAAGWLVRPVAGPDRESAPPPEVHAKPTEEQTLLSNIIDSMEGGVMTISSEGTVTSLNPVAQKTLGCEAQRVVGHHFGAVLADVPENRTLRRMISAALDEGQTVSSVEVSAATPSGETVSLGVTISLLRGEADRHRGIVLTFKNLAEITRLREQVQRTDQLASLGRLAAGMAHEIRNPLGSLHGLVELIQEDLSPDDPRRKYTATILQTIHQLNALVESLLEFSQPPVTQLEPRDLRELVHEAVQVCSLEFRDHPVTLREEYAEEPVVAPVDREALTRAVVNIARNAFQATPEGGTVTVSVHRRPPERPREPARAVVTIANSGSHVGPEERGKLFTPFFTTKPEGTGLGLPIAHQIVSAHSGQIEVESELDSGTAFHIMLPVPADAATAPVEQGLREGV